MKILEVKTFSKKILEGINKLIPQLSETAAPFSREKFKRMIAAEDAYLFLAEKDENYVGMVTLVVTEIPTATRAIIEDLVVDHTYLGTGLGKKLMSHACQYAKDKGATTVNLTCGPHRKSANALYKKLGFTLRETNVYKLDI